MLHKKGGVAPAFFVLTYATSSFFSAAKTGSGRAFVARKDDGAPNGLKALWWLVPHATIPGDRSLWPDDNAIRAEAEKAVRLAAEAAMGAKK